MAEIIRGQDPSIRAISYLGRYVDNVLGDVPAEWKWDGLLVVVTDVGGTGEYDVVLDDTSLMVEISHPDRATASETARTIHGLLRAWQQEEPGVYWRGTRSRPTYQPDDETRTPAYTMTVGLSFRGVSVEVPEI